MNCGHAVQLRKVQVKGFMLSEVVLGQVFKTSENVR